MEEANSLTKPGAQPPAAGAGTVGSSCPAGRSAGGLGRAEGPDAPAPPGLQAACALMIIMSLNKP